MITDKRINKIVSVMMAAAVFVCVFLMTREEKLTEVLGGDVVAMQYEEELFDTREVMQVDIQMSEDAWQDMLENAMAEEYYSCDVVINGTKICDVGIRPKGNTSLSSIAMDETTDRYSLKLEFDHYVEGQLCFGLDKLILNNNYADATNMKEAVIYDMYQYLDADASLYNYAEVSVKGEYWGVYLALEAVEDSFLLRNFGTRDGELYKPENLDGDRDPGRADGPEEKDFKPRGEAAPGEMPEGREPEGEAPGGSVWEGEAPGGDMPEEAPGEGMPGEDRQKKDMSEGEMVKRGMLEGGVSEEDMPGEAPGGDTPKRDMAERGMPGGKMPGAMDGKEPPDGFAKNSGGADLNYTDDNLDSYATIWEGEVTDTDESDHQRVLNALKAVKEGEDLERYLDVDNVLKYMAVHTFSVNMDSLSGNMAHNYYLYESGGKLNILPWDYNLSFGGMNVGAKGDASGVINDAIDTPFQGTEFFDALLANEEYLARYHEYLRKLTEEYVFGGKFEETYSRIRMQIDPLVKTDPTAFYSYEEYVAGAEMLRQTVVLRAESIEGQLADRIPSTDAGQRADASSLIDASEIDLGSMGTFERGF